MADSGANPLPTFDQWLLGDEQKKTAQPGAFKAGLASGIHGLAGLGGSALQGVGTLAGLPTISRIGKGFADDQNVTAARVGRPDLEIAPWQAGGASVAPWLTYQVAKMVPTLAGYAAATAAVPEAAIPAGLARLGAVLPEALGGGALRAGAGFAARRAALGTGTQLGKFAIGGGAFGGVTGFGQAIQSADQKPGGVTGSDALQAAAESPLYAAAGLLTPGFLHGALRGAEGRLATRVVARALSGGAVGAVQAGTLTALDQTFRPDLSTADKMTNIVDAAATGASVGGALGGVTGIRALKRVDPSTIDNATLEQTIDQQLALPAPPMFADSMGRVAPGSGGDETLRATPRDPAAPEEPPAAQPAEPALFGPGTVQDRSAMPGSTIVVGRRGEGGRFTNEATGVEQPAIVPEDTSRSYRNMTDAELFSAANALANRGESHGLTPDQHTMAKSMMAEIAFRRETTNGSLTENDVSSQPVEAVERANATNRRGTGQQDQNAPASATPDIAARISELTDGLRLPTSLKEKLASARSEDDIQNIVHDESIVQARAGKMRDTLAQRAGVLDAEGRPTALADEISTRKTNPDEPAPPLVGKADEAFKTQWADNIAKLAHRDPVARQLNPTTQPEAMMQLYRALGRYDEGRDATDRSGVERLAKQYGVLDDHLQLTPEALKLAQQDPITTEAAVKAAEARGLTDAEQTQFNKGAQDYVAGRPAADEGGAYMAGHAWAEETNSVPKEALARYKGRPVTEADRARIAGEPVPNDTIPPEVRQGQLVNEAIDNSGLHPATNETEVAALKRMVRQGDIEGAMDGLRRVQRGEGLFQQPQRTGPGVFKGETVTRGAPRGQVTAELVPTRGASRADAERAIRKLELTQMIHSAHGEGRIDNKQRVLLLNHLNNGRISEVTKVVGQPTGKPRPLTAGEAAARAARRADLATALDEHATQAQREAEVPELDGTTLRYARGDTAERGMSADRVRDAVTQATHGWKADVPVNVVDRVEDLPGDLQRQIHRDGAEDAHGFVHDGQVYLIGENLRDEEHAVATVYHEALGHLGLDKLFRTKLDKTLEAMYRSNEQLRTQVDAWRSVNPNAYDGSLPRAIEEVMAQASEKGRVNASLLAKIGAVIKEFARRAGMKLGYSDKEVSAILAMAHDQVINGRGKAGANGMRYMMALWHGSPHDFDRFLTDKMGTGEGAQVYGWGLYFAGAKEVAEHYRGALSKSEPAKVDGRDPHEWVKEHQPRDTDGKPLLDEDTLYRIAWQAEHMANNRGMWRDLRNEYDSDWMDARREAQDYKDAVRHGGTKNVDLEQRIERDIKTARAAIDMLDKLNDAKPTAKSRGKLYNVTVKQMHDRFLDWDKPLSEQSQHVKDALATLGFKEASADDRARLRGLTEERSKVHDEAMKAQREYSRADQSDTMKELARQRWIKALDARDYLSGEIDRIDTNNLTGAQIYKQLQSKFMDQGARKWKLFSHDGPTAPERASRALLEAGIAGNTYADGFARHGQEGKNNYVVFNHDDVDIAAKYSRPNEFADHTSKTVSSVVDAVDKHVDLEGRKGALRRGQLYATTIHHITEFYGKWFDTKIGDRDVNGVRQREQATDFREAIQQRHAQLVDDAMNRAYELERTDKKAFANVNRLMQFTQFGIHPARDWDGQIKEVRDNPSLKPVVEEARNIYRSLQTKGHIGVYDDMRKLNDVAMLSQTAMQLHDHIAADKIAQGRIDKFAENPMRRFMNEQAREDYGIQEAHDFWNRELNEQQAAITDFARQYETNPPVKLSAGEARTAAFGLKTLGDTVKGVQALRDKLEAFPNFHLGRDGEYFVNMRLRRTKDGKVDPQAMAVAAERLKEFGRVIAPQSDADHIYFRVDNTVAQANLIKAAEKLRGEGIVSPDSINAESGATTYGITSGKRSDDRIQSALAGQWANRLTSELDSNEHLKPEDREMLKNMVRAQSIDLLPDNNVSKMMAHRENIPGFDPDMFRSFNARMKTHIDAAAGLAVARDITDAYSNMRLATKRAQTAGSAHVPIAQRNGMTEVIDELSNHDKQHTNQPGGSKALNQLQAVSGAFFLSANLAYPVVNLVQVPMIALPELGAKHGFLKSAKTLSQVTPTALKVISAIYKNGRKAGISRAADAVLTAKALKDAGITGRKAEFLMQVANRGGIDIGGPSRELARNAKGTRGNKVDQTLRIASALGYYSETLSRLVVALASHDLDGHSTPVDKLAQDTVRTLKETMWDYSSPNTSRMLGRNGFLGKVTPLATQFMKYTAMLNEKLYREVYEATKGTTPEARSEARRFLAGHLAMTTVFAGTLGLPFASVFAATYDRLKDMFDGDNEPSDIQASFRNGLADMFGKDAAEVLARGAPRAGGIDLSTRVGEQDILPFSKFIADRRDFKDKLKDLQGRAWGAPTSMMLNVTTGLGRVAQGDVLGGFRQMLPLGLSSMVKSYQMTDQGFVDSKGNVLPMEPSTRDILAQAVGFNPAQNAEYNEARSDQMVRSGLLSRQAKVMRNQIIQALEDHDHDKAHELISQAMAFDQENPAYQVLHGIKGSLESRRRSAAISQRFGTPLGVNPRDIGAPQFTRYANVDYAAQ